MSSIWRVAKIKLFYNIHQPLLQGFEGHGWEGHELADGQQLTAAVSAVSEAAAAGAAAWVCRMNGKLCKYMLRRANLTESRLKFVEQQQIINYE